MGKDNPSRVTQKLKPYEIERMKIMAENDSRMKAKGYGSLLSKDLQKKYGQVASSVVNEICQPEEDMHDPRQTTCEADSVQVDVNNARGRKEKQPLVQTLPMAEFMKLKAQEKQQRKKKIQQSQPVNLIHEQGSKQIHQQNLTHQQENQKRKQEEVCMSLNQGKNEKNYCPPGSYSRYLQVKKIQASKGQQSVDAELESLEAELLRSSEDLRQPRSFGDVYENDFAEDASNNQNEVASEPDVIVENANSVSQRNCRRGWNNTDQQINVLSSPAYGNSKRQELDSQRVSRKLFPDRTVGQSELQTVPIIQRFDEAQELTISNQITCQGKDTSLGSKSRAVRSNALEDLF